MAHILIADDDELIHELYGEAFRRAGHSVGFVGDGIEVLDTLRARHVDLLVLDSNMPEMGGCQVLRTVRANGSWCMLPVIMLSGHSSPQDREIALNARADLFCSKASDPDWLVYQAESLMMEKGRSAPVAIARQPAGRRCHAC